MSAGGVAPGARTARAVYAPRVLTAGQLALLAAVQDRLIPHEGTLPGAGESGVPQRIDGYLAERPTWRPELLAALRAIEVASANAGTTDGTPTDPAARTMDGTTTGAAQGHAFSQLSEEAQERVLRAVEQAEPRAFRWLVRLTYMAYYTDEAVQRAHGFAAVPLPGGFTLPAFDETRLEPIRQRGKLWRDA